MADTDKPQQGITTRDLVKAAIAMVHTLASCMNKWLGKSKAHVASDVIPTVRDLMGDAERLALLLYEEEDRSDGTHNDNMIAPDGSASGREQKG